MLPNYGVYAIYFQSFSIEQAEWQFPKIEMLNSLICFIVRLRLIWQNRSELLWSNFSFDQVYQSRVKTTEILRDAVVSCEPGHRPKAFVQVTGVGYYPPSQEAVYDENSPG